MRRLVALLTVVGFTALVTLGGCQLKASEAQSQVQSGLRFEYGLVLGAAVRDQANSPGDAAMHGTAPQQANSYHVVLALFDATSGARVADGDVAMTLSGHGHNGGGSQPLDAMGARDQASYGGYIVLPEPGTYLMTFNVRRPGGHPSHVKAAFKFERPV